MLYSILKESGESVVTFIVPGDPDSPYVAQGDHPNFKAIIAALIEGDGEQQDIADLFDVATTISRKFEALSERVTVAHGRIFFDGDEVHNALTTQILRVLEEDAGDYGLAALVNFFEKIQQNPNEHSREQLFEWLDRHAFTITESGDIVGYKGVCKNSQGTLVSQHSGTAIVNGEQVTGQIPNEVGAVITMPRGAVHSDPATGCSHGLHVGTYEYATQYASGAMLEVHVNPRDVVSVPTDCNFQKVRCCRYAVAAVIDQPYSEAVLVEVDGSDEDDSAFIGGDFGFDNVDWA